jgi:hypothetical protein
MCDVIFENGQGVFRFDEFDVGEGLVFNSSQNHVKEYADLLRNLKSSSNGGKKIPIKNNSVGFIALALLGKNKGSVFCNICKKSYHAWQLRSEPMGLGRYPYTEKIIKGDDGKTKAILRRRIKTTGLQGGEKLECPKGHELIGMITWET